jgi:hypothetical protein
MKFFTFVQNNSFGVYDGPAQYVVVEAENAKDANNRAFVLGVYFDGCDSGIDCPCCGDRWCRQWYDEDGNDVPCYYGDPLIFDEPGVNTFLVVYANGDQKWAKIA